MSSLEWLHQEIVSSLIVGGILAYGVGCMLLEAVMIVAGVWSD